MVTIEKRVSWTRLFWKKTAALHMTRGALKRRMTRLLKGWNHGVIPVTTFRRKPHWRGVSFQECHGVSDTWHVTVQEYPRMPSTMNEGKYASPMDLMGEFFILRDEKTMCPKASYQTWCKALSLRKDYVYPFTRWFDQIRGWNPTNVASQEFARNTSASRTDWNLHVCIWIKSHRMISRSCFLPTSSSNRKCLLGVWPSNFLIQKIIPKKVKTIKNSSMFSINFGTSPPEIHGEDVVVLFFSRWSWAFPGHDPL